MSPRFAWLCSRCGAWCWCSTCRCRDFPRARALRTIRGGGACWWWERWESFYLILISGGRRWQHRQSNQAWCWKVKLIFHSAITARTNTHTHTHTHVCVYSKAAFVLSLCWEHSAKKKCYKCDGCWIWTQTFVMEGCALAGRAIWKCVVCCAFSMLLRFNAFSYSAFHKAASRTPSGANWETTIDCLLEVTPRRWLLIFDICDISWLAAQPFKVPLQGRQI